ncbi:hypothetical protein ACFPK9_09630 [Rubritalea spongiae]|uniref:DUF642 domain-containing protein n=1 Tax=Rubritalea spongiae TaxID=430797 RepID=A0ABW5E5G7_9BACT
MKNTFLLSTIALPLLASTVLAEKAPIWIDFGSAAGNATGHYNLINGAGLTGAQSIAKVKGTYPLIDTDGTPSGSVTVSSEATSNWGDSLADVNWTGSKPSALSKIQSAATDDGLFLHATRGKDKPRVSFAFSGLKPQQEYAILFYSARVDKGIGEGATHITVTKGNGIGASISNSFKNSEELGSFTVTSTSNGQFTLDFSIETNKASAVCALNFMSITPIAHQSSAALLHFGGITVTLSDPQERTD